MADRRLLLVEGISDQSLFNEFCRVHDFHADVKVVHPRDLGQRHNSKQGVVCHLDVLLPQMADGQLERLGLVLDADLQAHGGGFASTEALVTRTVRAHGYTTAPDALAAGGLVYRHNDGLPDVGLWVMPNNRDDGAVEAWIRLSLIATEQALAQHATAVVAALPVQKFRPAGRDKAEVATWLAWQFKPGAGLYYSIQGGLLDRAAPLYEGFLAWMARMFR